MLGQGGWPRGLPRHIEQPPVLGPEDGPAGSSPIIEPSEPQSEPQGTSAEPFDPSKHTIPEVQAYVEATPDALADVWAAETDETGKNRVSLVAWLEARTA